MTAPATHLKYPRIDVVYHADCLDGTAAAALLRRQYIAYKPTCYADDYRICAAPSRLTGGDVLYIVDFSYPGPMLDELCLMYANVVLIDHHAGAIKELAAYYTDKEQPANLRLILDETRSGAGITWDFLYDNAPRVPLIDMLEDNDIRGGRFPETPLITAAVSYEGVTVDAIARALDTPLQDLISIGTALSSAIDHQCRYCITHYQRLTEQGVPYIMAPRWLHSRIGDILATETDHELYMIYCLEADSIRVRLMSPKHGPDCSVLAKALGGGGHPHAARFNIVSTDVAELGRLTFPIPSH